MGLLEAEQAPVQAERRVLAACLGAVEQPERPAAVEHLAAPEHPVAVEWAKPLVVQASVVAQASRAAQERRGGRRRSRRAPRRRRCRCNGRFRGDIERRWGVEFDHGRVSLGGRRRLRLPSHQLDPRYVCVAALDVGFGGEVSSQTP